MNVTISGASGLVGTALRTHLAARGDRVHALVRRVPMGESEVRWDPRGGDVDAAALVGEDAVVHLAGENIADGRWNEERKHRIRDSRVDGTRFLCETLAGLEKRPSVLVCASAVGYYGDRGDEALDEGSAPGSNFLSGVCRDWEEACAPARAAGIRVVNLRIGVVLSRRGGALARMLLPFKLGAGGRIGSGDQWMSWIELGDLVGVIEHALDTESLAGPVNAVSPGAVTNSDFTHTLGRVLSRPTIIPMPAFAARLAFGEMADELLLASARVQPRALLGSGYAFHHIELESALRAALAMDGGSGAR